MSTLANSDHPDKMLHKAVFSSDYRRESCSLFHNNALI